MTQVLHLVRHDIVTHRRLLVAWLIVVLSHPVASLLPWPALSAAGFAGSARHDRRPVGPWRRGNRHSHPERQSAGRPHLLAHSPDRCRCHGHGQARHRCLVRRRSAPRRPDCRNGRGRTGKPSGPPRLRRSSSLTPQPWASHCSSSSTTRGVASMLVALLGTLFGYLGAARGDRRDTARAVGAAVLPDRSTKPAVGGPDHAGRGRRCHVDDVDPDVPRSAVSAASTAARRRGRPRARDHLVRAGGSPAPAAASIRQASHRCRSTRAGSAPSVSSRVVSR